MSGSTKRRRDVRWADVRFPTPTPRFDADCGLGTQGYWGVLCGSLALDMGGASPVPIPPQRPRQHGRRPGDLLPSPLPRRRRAIVPARVLYHLRLRLRNQSYPSCERGTRP